MINTLTIFKKRINNKLRDFVNFLTLIENLILYFISFLKN